MSQLLARADSGSMATSSARSIWSQVGRGLVLLAILIGAMSALSLPGGRRGDLEAGTVGAAVGGLIGGVIVAIELIGRSLARKCFGADAKEPCKNKDA